MPKAEATNLYVFKEKDEDIKKLKKYTKEMTDKLFKNVLMFHPFRNQ